MVPPHLPLSLLFGYAEDRLYPEEMRDYRALWPRLWLKPEFRKILLVIHTEFQKKSFREETGMETRAEREREPALLHAWVQLHWLSCSWNYKYLWALRYGCWDPNSSPPAWAEEHFTAKPSLQPWLQINRKEKGRDFSDWDKWRDVPLVAGIPSYFWDSKTYFNPVSKNQPPQNKTKTNPLL